MTLDPKTCATESHKCGDFVVQNGMVANGVCSTSILSVIATKLIKGAFIQCVAKGQFASQIIGQDYLSVVSPPSMTIRTYETIDEILVELNISSEKSSTASVSLLDSDNNMLAMFSFSINDTESSKNVTFRGWKSNTSYFLRAIVTNCAGTTELIQPVHTCTYNITMHLKYCYNRIFNFGSSKTTKYSAFCVCLRPKQRCTLFGGGMDR